MRKTDTKCKAGLRLASACFLAAGFGCAGSVELPAPRPAENAAPVAVDATRPPRDASAPPPGVCPAEDRWLAESPAVVNSEAAWLLAAHARALCSHLQSRLPADWELEVRLLADEGPRGWTVERALGIELRLRNRTRARTAIRPYSALYAPADRVQTTEARLTRRLFYELRGGYALLDPGVAPDRIFAVTEEFVILAPSAFGVDADADALEPARLFDEFYEISPERTDRLSVQLEISPPSVEAVQAQFPDRRALVVHETLARRLWLTTF